MDQASVSKTQNVIRSKFTDAFTNRLESEHNVDQALQPLVRKPVKVVDNANVENSAVDLNELCNRLRFLLSTRFASKVDHADEINAIISKLRNLNLLE